MARQKKTRAEVEELFNKVGFGDQIRLVPIPGKDPERPDSWLLMESDEVLVNLPGSRMLDYLEGAKDAVRGRFLTHPRG